MIKRPKEQTDSPAVEDTAAAKKKTMKSRTAEDPPAVANVCCSGRAKGRGKAGEVDQEAYVLPVGAARALDGNE